MCVVIGCERSGSVGFGVGGGGGVAQSIHILCIIFIDYIFFINISSIYSQEVSLVWHHEVVAASDWSSSVLSQSESSYRPTFCRQKNKLFFWYTSNC